MAIHGRQYLHLIKTAMRHDIYLNMKALIKNEADRETKKDKAYRRYVLNNCLDDLIRQLNNHYVLKEVISESQARIYEAWLTNYTISRHDR